MDKKTRGCLWAALGGVVLLLLVGAVLAGGVAWVAYQNSSLQQSHLSAQDAGQKMAQARARFAGQTALVTMVPGEPPRVARRDGHGRIPESLHVMSWEPRHRQLSELRLPFWLVRLGGAKARLMTGDAALRDFAGAPLTVGDIEEAGPGLLFDHTDASGSQVLIWAE